MSSSEKKERLGNGFYLKVITVFCLLLLLSFIARFVISMWI